VPPPERPHQSLEHSRPEPSKLLRGLTGLFPARESVNPRVRDDTFEDLGPNSGLVDEMYRRIWRTRRRWRRPGRFFSDLLCSSGQRRPSITGNCAAPAAGVKPGRRQRRPRPCRHPPSLGLQRPLPARARGRTTKRAPLRGARIVGNREASPRLPTVDFGCATCRRSCSRSQRQIPQQPLFRVLARVRSSSRTSRLPPLVCRGWRGSPPWDRDSGVYGWDARFVVRHDHVNLGPRGRKPSAKFRWLRTLPVEHQGRPTR